MSNYLETLVENMIADGVPESDIKEVIKEVTKKSPLKQDDVVVGGTESSGTVPETVVTTTPGTPPETQVVPTGTQVVPTVAPDDAVAVEEEKKELVEEVQEDIETQQDLVDEKVLEQEIPKTLTAEEIYSYMAQEFLDKYTEIENLQNIITDDPNKKNTEVKEKISNLFKEGFSTNERLAKEEIKAFQDYLLERGIFATPEGDFATIGTSNILLEPVDVTAEKGADHEAAFADIYTNYSPDKEQAKKELDAGVMEQFKTLYNKVESIDENDQNTIKELAEQYFDVSTIQPRTEQRSYYSPREKSTVHENVIIETKEHAIKRTFGGKKYKEYLRWKENGALPEGFKNRFPPFTIDNAIQKARKKIIENAMRGVDIVTEDVDVFGGEYGTTKVTETTSKPAQADAWTRALTALYGSTYERDFLEDAIRLGRRDEDIFSNYCQRMMNLAAKSGYKDGKWVATQYKRLYESWKKIKEGGLDGWKSPNLPSSIYSGVATVGPNEEPTMTIGGEYLISTKQRLRGWYIDQNGKLVNPKKLDFGKGLARAQYNNVVRRMNDDMKYIKAEYEALPKLAENWVTEYADVWKERHDIVNLLNTVVMDVSAESSEADRQYYAGLLQRLKEIYPKYVEAVEAQGRIAARTALLEYDMYIFNKDLDKIDENTAILNAIKKEYNNWKIFGAQMRKMGMDMASSFNMIAGRDYVTANLELRKRVEENYAGPAKISSVFKGEIGFWDWVPNMLATNGPSGMAMLAMMIPFAGPTISRAIFLTWSSGGEYTTRQGQKETAALQKEYLEKQLLGLKEQFDEGKISKEDYIDQREYYQNLILVQNKILDRTAMGDWLISASFGAIDTLTESLGSMRMMSKWMKMAKTEEFLALTQRGKLLAVAKQMGIQLPIETLEEVVAEISKNLIRILNGEVDENGNHYSISHGIDLDFFGDVVGFSLFLSKIGALRPISNIIKNACLTSQERQRILEIIGQVDLINEQLSDKSKLTKANIKEFEDKKLDLLAELSIVEAAALAKIGLLNKDELKEIFDLDAQKRTVQNKLFQLGLSGRVDADAKKIQEDLENQLNIINNKIDSFFDKIQTEKLTPKIERKDKELNVSESFDQGLYLSSLQTAKTDQEANGKKQFVIRLDDNGKPGLDSKTESELRERLSESKLTESQIETIIDDIKTYYEDFNNAITFGLPMEAMYAEVLSNGDQIIYEQPILLTLATSSSVGERGDAAVSPLHETFHEYHKRIGLAERTGKGWLIVNENSLLAIEGLTTMMESKLNDGTMKQDVYDHFLKRLQRYETYINTKYPTESLRRSMKAEELLNIIGDMMLWGGLKKGDLINQTGLKLYLQALVRKIKPDFRVLLEFNTADQIFAYISRFHTEAKGGYIAIGVDVDEIDSDLSKPSLSAEQLVEIEQIDQNKRKRNQEAVAKIKEINDRTDIFTQEKQKLIEEIREETKKKNQEDNIRKEEIEKTLAPPKMSLEERSRRVQEVYENTELTDQQKKEQIVDLMAPYVTSLVKRFWDFGLAKSNVEQAFTHVDFRNELNYELMKRIDLYKPAEGTALSWYIMTYLSRDVADIFERNVVNVARVEFDQDTKYEDESGEYVEHDSEVNTFRLSEAIGFEKSDKRRIVDKVYKQIAGNIPQYQDLVENNIKIQELENKLNNTKDEKDKQSIREEISKLESSNENILSETLNTDKKRKDFRNKLEFEFVNYLKSEVKKLVNPSNRRGTDKVLRDFLTNNKRDLINLIAVKYKKRFPELSTFGGRMNTEKSIESQTSMDGSFVTSTTAGNDIWIKNHDMTIQEFVDLFTTGRETRYNSLINSLANELGLDAVHEALPSELSTIVGRIVETVKRDPLTKFSLGGTFTNIKKFYAFDLSGTAFSDGVGVESFLANPEKYEANVIQIAGLISRSDYESIIDEENLSVIGFEEEFTRFEVATIINIHNKIGLQQADEIRYKNAVKKLLKKEGLTSILEQFEKDGNIRRNGNLDKNGDGVLDRLYRDVSVIAKLLGPGIMNKLGYDILNFHYVGMDAGAKKEDPNWDGKDKSKKYLPGVTGPFYERLQELKAAVNKIKVDHGIDVDLIAIYNSKSGLMNAIQNNVLNPTPGAIKKYGKYKTGKDAPSIEQQKLDRLEKLYGDQIREANKENIKLFKFIVKTTIQAVADGKISPVGALHFLQSQTNLAKGLRGLTSLDFITVQNTVQDYLTKGEHVEPMGNTSMDITTLMFEYVNFNSKGEIVSINEDIDLDTRINNIASGHTQWFGPKELMDIMDKILGTNSTLRFDRAKALTPEMVKKALDNGKIDKEEYNKYIKILNKYDGINSTFGIDGRTYWEIVAQLEANRVINEQTAEIEKQYEEERLVQQAIQNILYGPSQGGSTFDFDETLAYSDNIVIATHKKTGEKKELNSDDWKTWRGGTDWNYDFTDFNYVTNGKPGPLMPKLINKLQKYGPEHIYILTARHADSAPAILAYVNSVIDEYNAKYGTSLPYLLAKNIVGLGNSTGEAKADWIEKNLIWKGYNDIYFVDDALPNITAVDNMLKKYPKGVLEEGTRAELVEASKANTDYKMIVMVGAAGSSKSTVINKSKLNSNYEILNSDTFLEAALRNPKKVLSNVETTNKAGVSMNALEYVFGDTKVQEIPQSQIEANEKGLGSQWARAQIVAIRLHNEAVEKAIQEGKGIVIDGTASSAQNTQDLLISAKENGYQVAAIHTSVSKENSVDRNRKRERRLFDHIVEGTWDNVVANIEMYQQEDMFGDNFFMIDTDNLNLNDPLPGDFIHDVSNFTLRKPFIKPSLGATFNVIMEDAFQIDRKKKISDVQAAQRGKKRNRFNIFLTPSADDFRGLLLRLTGDKDQNGDAHLKWYEDNLIKPYIEGTERIDKFRVKLMKDYKSLLKNSPGIKKKLKQKINRANGKFSGFRVQDAIRVYLWHKNNIDIPGISKADRALLVKTVENDQQLETFANHLSAISNQKEGYIKPGDYWTTETIAVDIQRMSIVTNRAENLKTFLKNRDEIFSKDNLNKIEMAMGPDFREALEDILHRMETGLNRDHSKMGRIERAWDKWVNNSVGAIMFLNVRSGILQTLSSLNYVDWRYNNPYAAARAFANQEEFWKTFLEIWESDMLVERREGNRFDLQLSEVLALVRNSSNPARAVLEKLLSMGALSKYGDSFAIAFGGATFLMNARKHHAKTAPNLQEAERLAWFDFRAKTQEAQQSADPMYISQQQAGGLGRIILSFKNTPMQYYRLMKAEILLLQKGLSPNPSASIAKIAYYGAIQNFMFTALQTALFAALDEDDDEWEKKSDRVIQSMVDNILYGMGLQGAVVATVKNGVIKFIEQEERGWNADHAYTIIQFAQLSPTLGSKLRTLYTGIQTLKYKGEVIDYMDWWDPQNPAWMAVANFIQAFTNIPAAKIPMAINNLLSISSNENEWWQNLALLLQWNTWDVGVETKADKLRDIAKDFAKDIQQEAVNIEAYKKEKKEGKKDIKCVAASDNESGRCGNPVKPGLMYCTVHEKVEQREDGEETICKGFRTNGKPCNMPTRAKSGLCVYHD
jgi:predicted kinase